MSAAPSSYKRVLGVLGGVSLRASVLAAWANSATFITAADGGADALLGADFIPHLVVGDLDSLVADRSLFPDVREDASQSSTDADKLLAVLADLGCHAVTLLNVAGGLPDHTLAILHSAAKSRLACRLVYNHGFGHVLKGPITASFNCGGRVSLLPLTACGGVSMSGVRWPLDRAELDPLGSTSISNAATAPAVKVTLDFGAAFLYIEDSIAPVWPQ